MHICAHKQTSGNRGSGGLAAGFLLVALVGCGAGEATRGAPPPELLGAFVDDYGTRHLLTDSTWTHGSTLYRVSAWHPREEHLLLAAGPARPAGTEEDAPSGYEEGAPSRSEETAASDGTAPAWLRIDWVLLDSGVETHNENGAAEPGEGADAGNPTRWRWAYCMAIWDADSASEALAAPASNRASPRNGCGSGHPFSRMAREPAQDRSDPDPARERPGR